VRDVQALDALFRRIGWLWPDHQFETKAALLIERRVRREVMLTPKCAP